eukprot:TRINITY_DN5756_c0_g1_i1.p1 TRINITY_DN5756_c0_g1~~TRINITY_DN5756_c0_g1_i1.p1  ORF type:complete len:354 (+),score=89.70 TRINITY_DN5756_c0_g1_i1:105-1064(+)
MCEQEPSSIPPSRLFQDQKPVRQYDDDAAQNEIDRLTSNTSEVQDLINMYKDLLKGQGSTMFTDEYMNPPNDNKPTSHDDPVLGAHNLYMQDLEASRDMADLEEQVSVLESKVKKEKKKPGVVYTEYHKQMERVEEELEEARRDRRVLVEQNAALESRCLGLERDFETLRKQHVELHVNTQTTNEKLISYIQGLMKSINELSDRVRTLEGGGGNSFSDTDADEQQQQQQQPAATHLPAPTPTPRTLTVADPPSLLHLHPAQHTPPTHASSPDESVGTLSSSPSPSFSLRAEIRRQLGAGYPNPNIPTPSHSIERVSTTA